MFVHSYTITDTIILIHVDHVSTINVHHIFWPSVEYQFQRKRVLKVAFNLLTI